MYDWVWNAAQVFAGKSSGDSRSNPWPPYAVIVLNSPIEHKELFVNVCNRAQLVVAADGGANRIHDLGLGDSESQCLPDYIVGDLDSIRPSVKAYFKERSCVVEVDPDQYAHDFQKACRLVDAQWPSRRRRPANDPVNCDSHPQNIIVVGSLGGRLDQAFALLGQLLMLSTSKGRNGQDMKRKVWLMAPDGMGCVLKPGHDLVQLALRRTDSTQNSIVGGHVGLIPLLNEATMTTRGLRWELCDYHSRFGSQMSTSNEAVSVEIQVSTTQPVLLTTEWINIPGWSLHNISPPPDLPQPHSKNSSDDPWIEEESEGRKI